jgi:tRNA A37 methylthiotransferase MiaB
VEPVQFCIVPNTRPGYESFPTRLIVEEVRRSVMEGCREVWLTSQDMGSYGLESGRNLLPELLEAVNSVEGRFYTRVGMMNPIYLGQYSTDSSKHTWAGRYSSSSTYPSSPAPTKSSKK